MREANEQSACGAVEPSVREPDALTVPETDGLTVPETDGLSVRPAQEDDLYGAAVARVASWRGAFTGLVPQDFLDAMDPAAIATAWKGSIAAGRSRLYVAASDHQIVGYSSVGPAREGPADTGELYALFVHPDWWGTNAGRQLTDAAIADLQAQGCGEVWLWVLEANARARAFYRRYGFAETPARTTSSLNNLPELRLALDLRTANTQ
jgi:ribosomal protein S18 acetylase RimI-like enzyme